MSVYKIWVHTTMIYPGSTGSPQSVGIRYEQHKIYFLEAENIGVAFVKVCGERGAQDDSFEVTNVELMLGDCKIVK